MMSTKLKEQPEQSPCTLEGDLSYLGVDPHPEIVASRALEVEPHGLGLGAQLGGGA